MKRENFPIPGLQIPPHQPNLYDRILTPQASASSRTCTASTSSAAAT
jgi:hypothetical protein